MKPSLITIFIAIALFSLNAAAQPSDVAALRKSASMLHSLGESTAEESVVALDQIKEALDKGVESGKVNSYYLLGKMYLEGIHVNKDIEKGMDLVRSAAESGLSLAQYEIGSILANKNSRESLFWLEAAAAQNLGEAQFLLGAIYESGNIVPENILRAYYWYFLASTDGNKAGEDFRDRIGQKITNAERSRVIEFARKFRPQTPHEVHFSEDFVPGRAESSLFESKSSGSGVRIATNTFLTNSHVIADCARIKVNDIDGNIIAQDKRGDLALITAKVSGPKASLSSRPIKIGDSIIMAGYPLFDILKGINITNGLVSALSGPDGDTRLFQYSAPTQVGNSGGPLLDSTGNIVGLVISKLDGAKVLKLTGDIPQNINFAIGANSIKSFLAAHNIPDERTKSNQEGSTASIAARAQKFTVVVVCSK